MAKQRQKRHDEFYIDTCDLSSDVKQKLINTVTDHLFQKGVVTLMEYSLSAAEPLLAKYASIHHLPSVNLTCTLAGILKKNVVLMRL